jgi:argininosuccinate lyase
LLAFPRITGNSLDAVSDRDHLVEAMSAAALGSVHLSRIGEELVLFTSAEFGFVRLPDAFTTGSSLMPQKKNPDMAELVRGKAGRVIGDLVALLVVLKGLPLAYNKDMQEDKEPLFDALATWHDCITATADMLARAHWQKASLAAALDKGFLLATDLADALVNAGVPFRQAHEQIAELVGKLTRNQLTFVKYGAAKIATDLGLPEATVRETLNVQRALRRRDIPGAPHPRRVKLAARAMQKRALALHGLASRALQPMPVEAILRDA